MSRQSEQQVFGRERPLIVNRDPRMLDFTRESIPKEDTQCS